MLIMKRRESIKDTFVDSLERLSQEREWIGAEELASEVNENLPKSPYDRLLGLFGLDRRFHYLYLAAEALADEGEFSFRVEADRFRSYMSMENKAPETKYPANWA